MTEFKIDFCINKWSCRTATKIHVPGTEVQSREVLSVPQSNQLRGFLVFDQREAAKCMQDEIILLKTVIPI